MQVTFCNYEYLGEKRVKEKKRETKSMSQSKSQLQSQNVPLSHTKSYENAISELLDSISMMI